MGTFSSRPVTYIARDELKEAEKLIKQHHTALAEKILLGD